MKVLFPATKMQRCRPLERLPLLVLCLSLGGCGSANKDGSPAASVERGAIPPEWASPQQANPGGPASQPGPPAKPLAASTDSGGEATTVTAVDRYHEMVRELGGQAEIHLDFSRTSITDDVLARLPLPDTVRSIDLSVTQIGDSGLEHLLRARRLERLNLSGTQVTAAGTNTLKKMPYLWSVNLDQTQVPIDGQLQLMKFFASRAEARTRANPR